MTRLRPGLQQRRKKGEPSEACHALCPHSLPALPPIIGFLSPNSIHQILETHVRPLPVALFALSSAISDFSLPSSDCAFFFFLLQFGNRSVAVQRTEDARRCLLLLFRMPLGLSCRSGQRCFFLWVPSPGSAWWPCRSPSYLWTPWTSAACFQLIKASCWHSQPAS